MALTDLRNAESRIVNWINRIDISTSHKLAALYGGESLIDVCRSIEETELKSIYDVKDVFRNLGCDEEETEECATELVEYVYDELLARQQVKLDAKMNRLGNRAANRAQYIPSPVFSYYEYKPGELRWRFEEPLRSDGTLAQYVEHLYGFQETPVAMGVLLLDGSIDDNKLLNEKAMDALAESGVIVSGERLGYIEGDPNNPTPGSLMLSTIFPDAVSWGAYVHGLNAPVLPYGFLPEVEIGFEKLVAPDGTDLETDGSGIYHPETPELQEFIRKYGLVAIQMRIIHKGGLFAKGVWFPSNRALVNGRPGIVCDWRQVKGVYKKKAKENRLADIKKTVKGCAVGALQCWSRPGKLSACFEMLECLLTNPRTKKLVQKKVKRAMKRLAQKGLEGIAAEVARKDPVIKLILQLLQAGKLAGLDIKPWQIPRVREAIGDRLARTLYVIAQGAGIKLDSFVARIDATIPEGKCVVSGIPAGRKVVGFRFPIVLAQGLLSLETIDPPEHLLVNGALSVHTVVMNPADILKAQGDDDGDIFGISDDPDMVELFEHKIRNDILLIEPKGVARLGKDGTELKINSPEGRLYARRDNRGPVGWTTIQRSRLLAVGLVHAADAMSVSSQECIDQAKRYPEWTDVREAALPENWTLDSQNRLQCVVRFDPSLTKDGYPINLVKDWVDNKLIQAGCHQMSYDDDGTPVLKARDPLWWRRRNKRIDVDEWFVPAIGEEGTQFENLVHWASRCAYDEWQVIGKDFIYRDGEVSLPLLLPVILQMKGINAMPIEMDDVAYQRLKGKLGLNRYNQKLATILRREDEEDESGSAEEEDLKHKQKSLFTLQKELEETLRSGLKDGSITLDEIMTVWVRETAPNPNPGQPGPNSNNAFRVICFEDSPIMEMLGIGEQTKCPFLYRGETDRLAYIVDKALEQADPFKALGDIIQNARRHGDGFTNKDGTLVEEPIADANGEPVHLHECPECLNTIQSALVYRLRTSKTAKQRTYLTDLHGRLTNFMAEEGESPV